MRRGISLPSIEKCLKSRSPISVSFSSVDRSGSRECKQFVPRKVWNNWHKAGIKRLNENIWKQRRKNRKKTRLVTAIFTETCSAFPASSLSYNLISCLLSCISRYSLMLITLHKHLRGYSGSDKKFPHMTDRPHICRSCCVYHIFIELSHGPSYPLGKPLRLKASKSS